jgi:hypothetical protein
MNKPIILVVAGLALVVSLSLGFTNMARAQYGVGGSPVTAPSPDEQQFCKDHGIPQSECYENNVVAMKRLLAAQTTTYGNQAVGSGTPMLATQGGQLAVFVGALGAIFGGVAAMFFIKGRGSKPVTT